MSRVIAFFDLDETLLTIDSAMSWMRFLRRRGEADLRFFARAVYWSLLYRAAILDLDTLSVRLVQTLAGEREDEMWSKCQIWYRQELAHRVSVDGRQALRRHREAGDQTVLLTASSQYAARAVGQPLGFDALLSTELEVRDGLFTGAIARRCFGRHKLEVARAFCQHEGQTLAEAYFYTDSYNDRPLLEEVGHPRVVNPDIRLRWLAARRAWPVEAWR